MTNQTQIVLIPCAMMTLLPSMSDCLKYIKRNSLLYLCYSFHVFFFFFTFFHILNVVMVCFNKTRNVLYEFLHMHLQAYYLKISRTNKNQITFLCFMMTFSLLLNCCKDLGMKKIIIT